jgi:hypothetical protein
LRANRSQTHALPAQREVMGTYLARRSNGLHPGCNGLCMPLALTPFMAACAVQADQSRPHCTPPSLTPFAP